MTQKNDTQKMAASPPSRLNVRGLCCPLPLIQLAKTVKTLEPGQSLEIIGNDPIFESSVRDFCQAHGHSVLDATPDDTHGVCILIKLGG